MTAPDAAPSPATPTDEDLDGWTLGRSSWQFHRTIHKLVGRCLEYREYSDIVAQIRSGTAEVIRFGSNDGRYRITLHDGVVVDVTAWAGKPKAKRYYELKRADRPLVDKPKAKRPTDAPAAVSPAPPAPAAPARPIRATTLTLGARSAAAAELVADRLRPRVGRV